MKDELNLSEVAAISAILSLCGFSLLILALVINEGGWQ